jgi:alpha-D-ribose 1-methylphosphonate 5-triphosphate synthase subunit PhnH
VSAPLDPVLLGHAVYRPLLQAMSRPGTVWRLPAEARSRPLVALLGAIADREVAFHVAAADDAALGREIAWATGARPAALEEADFVIFPWAESVGRALRARRGTLEYPDGGATLVYVIRRCAPEGGRAVLRGPGIRDAARPALEGLDPRELGWLREANAAFPLGVDAIFLDSDAQVICIPRSTRIEEG